MNLLLRVLPDGRVASVNVAVNTGLSPGVVHCVVSMADSLSFHAPGGNGSVLAVGIALTTRPLSDLEAHFLGPPYDMPSRPVSMSLPSSSFLCWPRSFRWTPGTAFDDPGRRVVISVASRGH
jgi:hypothetical protein